MLEIHIFISHILLLFLFLQFQRAGGEAPVLHIVPPPSPNHSRQARSAPVPPSGQLANYNQPQEDADARNSLSQLLARLLSRKGECGVSEDGRKRKTVWSFPFAHPYYTQIIPLVFFCLLAASLL